MEELEVIANFEKISGIKELDEERTLELRKVCCLYCAQKANIKPGSFHEIKYNTYDFPYFLGRIKEGKTPLDIMLNIIDECEEYSKSKIWEKHLKSMGTELS
jgi:hypothetical protein